MILTSSNFYAKKFFCAKIAFNFFLPIKNNLKVINIYLNCLYYKERKSAKKIIKEIFKFIK